MSYTFDTEATTSTYTFDGFGISWDDSNVAWDDANVGWGGATYSFETEATAGGTGGGYIFDDEA